MLMNRWVRVSSKVLFNPRRAATTACTLKSSCSNSFLKPSSDFANAKVSLPVLKLVFIGAITPKVANKSANLGLLIRLFRSVSASSSSLSFMSLISSKWLSSNPRSKSNIGSINIRKVKSMIFNSFLGKPLPMIPNSL